MKWLKFNLWILVFPILILSCTRTANEGHESQTAYELVNPFIGTGGHGHTYPGATMPFGMVQLSPDTRLEGWDGCSGYHYTDSVIYGFSHTHLSGTGVSDYGDILLTPFQLDGNLSFEEAMTYQKTTSSFLKSSEEAKPGKYQVKLEDFDVDVQLTATPRVGIHNYTFNKEGDNRFLLNLNHRDKVLESKINIENNNTISGYRISQAWANKQQVYFVIHFSSPFTELKFDEEQDLLAQLSFAENKVKVKVALSSTSIDGARKNMNIEADHWDFEEYERIAQSTWEQALNKVEVSGNDQDKLSIFYSALYHTMIAPNLISDVDGRYRGMDGEVHHNPRTPTYTIFSLWDTFRATHPLYTIIEQDRTKAFINTFLSQYQQGGKLPVWELAANETNCMIGYHSVSVITDAYNKGITGFNTKLALEAMKSSAESDEFGLGYYQNNGYIGAGDEPESVSKTLEYAYDDWCIAQFADLINDSLTHKTYSKRALYYQNLFDPQTNFLRARMNGAWFSPFDPAEVNFNYTEANAWQYSLFAPHDLSGMIDLMGGKEAFEERLDDLFTVNSETTGREQADITGLIGQYAHGNEPSHHMAYLYNYIERPWKTQERVHQILNEQYQNQADGLSGNEDCGQMSAWYILSAMGFYSVTPGLDYYAIGTPHFDEMTINLENGNKFRIKANNLSDKNFYIQSASLNGKAFNTSFISHEDIMRGGDLVFEMGPKAVESWGTGKGNYPETKVSKSDFVPAPYFFTESMTFTDSLTIELGVLNKEAQIWYSLNGADFKLYEKPLLILENADVKAYSLGLNQKDKSAVVESQFKKIKKGRSITIESKYANQYAAGGTNTLIDQLRGNTNYRTGFWQGYQGQDVVVTIDLGKKETINSIRSGFLQDIKSWIWYPEKVEYYLSDDGKFFNLVAEVNNDFPDDTYGAFTQELSYNGKHQARYVKVVVPYYGDCPDWHLGAGGKSWIFMDEIVVE